jgi:hypothetical protein
MSTITAKDQSLIYASITPSSEDKRHFNIFGKWPPLIQAYYDWYAEMPAEDLAKHFGLIKDPTCCPPFRRINATHTPQLALAA